MRQQKQNFQSFKSRQQHWHRHQPSVSDINTFILIVIDIVFFNWIKIHLHNTRQHT